MSSIEPKFDTLEMFYRELIGLKFLNAKPESFNHKFTVLNNASELYNDLFMRSALRMIRIIIGSKNMILKI